MQRRLSVPIIRIYKGFIADIAVLYLRTKFIIFPKSFNEIYMLYSSLYPFYLTRY